MYIRENTQEQTSLIPSNFYTIHPFDRRTDVQGRAMFSSQRRLLENLHKVPTIRFLGSASSTPARCG